MGLDLTAKNGLEGRISVWAYDAFDAAVESNGDGEYLPCFDLWSRGFDVDKDTCERIANALDRAVRKGFFEGWHGSRVAINGIRCLKASGFIPIDAREYLSGDDWGV